MQPDQPIWPLGWCCPGCGVRVAESAGIPLFAPELADTVSGFDPAAFEMLVKVEQTHFWFVARNKLIVGLAERFFPRARRYLEIGCGNGAVLGALANSRHWDRLVGSDLHPAGLVHARARLPQAVEFAQLDARYIPAEAAFDLVGAYDIIEHVADDEAALRAIRRATAPGGGAIVAVPQHPSLWSQIDELGHHQRRYRRGELESKLKRAGFEPLFSTSFMALLLPLMAASRWRARGGAKRAAPETEFSLSPLVNHTLKLILQAEVGLTLAGMRWPIGGSRIVVARAA